MQEQVRTAEVIAALSLATDLAIRLPLEHGLESTVVAMRLGERLGVDPETAMQTYYACLLFYVGCTADAEIAAELFGADLREHFGPAMFGSRAEQMRGLALSLAAPERTRPVRAAHIAWRLPGALRIRSAHLAAQCEVGEMLTERLGLPTPVQTLFVGFSERWDGKGWPGAARGSAIPLPVRIAHVARDATMQRLLGGSGRAARVVGERAGGAFDPEIARPLADHAEELLAFDPSASAWDQVLGSEPSPRPTLADETIDRALAAIADFGDLISPYLAGHSQQVAELAEAAATRCGLDPADVITTRRAALVHDVGRVAIPARIWQKPGPLTSDEWEQVRTHPYYTDRVLSRSPFLAELAPVASADHERLDGSGYYRGTSGARLGVPARLLAAADAYQAMLEPRPHRDALAPAAAATRLGDEASAGRLDADAVTAVLEAAGQRVPRIDRPAGLTDREAEIVGLLARGLQTKQVARALGISVKTADTHIQSAYRKMGVSSRAAAALFAMEHGLLASGELPIVRPAPPP